MEIVYDRLWLDAEKLLEMGHAILERAQGLVIFLNCRLVMYYSYQSDLGDGWEDPEVHKDPPEKRQAALRMGVNLFTYAVTAVR